MPSLPNNKDLLKVSSPILLALFTLITATVFLSTNQLDDRSRASNSTPSPTPAYQTVSPPQLPEIVCIDLYQPVCGTDDKTYSNECTAQIAGASISHSGICQTK